MNKTKNVYTHRGVPREGGRDWDRETDRDREKGGDSLLLWPATSGPEACPGGWLICITPLEKTDFNFLGLGVCVHLFSVCVGGGRPHLAWTYADLCVVSQCLWVQICHSCCAWKMLFPWAIHWLSTFSSYRSLKLGDGGVWWRYFIYPECSKVFYSLHIAQL